MLVAIAYIHKLMIDIHTVILALLEKPPRIKGKCGPDMQDYVYT